MTTFPLEVIFFSDDNIAELVEVLPKETEARYRYTVSQTKKGKTFTITLDYINRLFESKLLEVKK